MMPHMAERSKNTTSLPEATGSTMRRRPAAGVVMDHIARTRATVARRRRAMAHHQAAMDHRDRADTRVATAHQGAAAGTVAARIRVEDTKQATIGPSDIQSLTRSLETTGVFAAA